MQRLLLAFVFVALSTPIASANVVFNTLGPGNTYNQSNGFAVGGPSSSLGNTFESASQFVAQAGGALSEVDLGLTVSDGGPVNVYLAGDAGGSPDSLSEILLGSVTPTQAFGSTNNSLVMLTSLNGASVTAGTTYWLVLKPGSNTTRDTWNRSLGTSGMQELSHDDSTWIQQNTTLAAFSISSVPEPRSVAPMIFAAVFALAYGRAQFRRRRSNR